MLFRSVIVVAGMSMAMKALEIWPMREDWHGEELAINPSPSGLIGIKGSAETPEEGYSNQFSDVR